MELHDYLRVLRRSWILIVAVTLLGLCAGAGATLVMKPRYESHTQLYVSVQNSSSGVGDLVQGSTFARQSVLSYVNIVTTQSVLGPVISRLDLPVTVPELATSVRAEAPLNTSLVDITVTNTDAAAAAQIANAIGVSFTHLVQDELEVPQGATAEASRVKLTTVQPATPAATPVSPRGSLNLSLGAFLGLVLGVGIAMLRAVLDTRIRGIRDIWQVTDTPLLGGIAFDPNVKQQPLIVHSDPRSPRAESFRTLRTNLQFLAVSSPSEQRGRSFVISSALPGEGKSTTVANLAIALAESGARVCLVDCDLRLPRVATLMGIEGAVGLTDVLIGRAEVTDVLQRWGDGQLFVLPSGKVPPNPSELLGSQAMTVLLGLLTGLFDFVLLDAPPLLVVTDAAVVGKHSDGTLLVAASGSTKKHDLEAAVRALNVAGGQLRGIVVTMLPARGTNTYGYGNYNYYGDARDVVAPEISRAASLAAAQGRSQRSGKRGGGA